MIFRPCLFLASALLLSSPSSALAAEKRYALSDFDHVQVFGPFQVTITAGRATSVTAIGNAQAIDMASVISSGGILTIQTRTRSRSSWKDDPQAPARIVIIVPQLKSVRLLGSGSVSVAEIRGISSNVTLNGGGQLTVARLTSDVADVFLSGSGRVTLGGTAKAFNANVSGSGDLDASKLTASDIKIVSATSGRISAKALRSANVKQNGAGEVVVSGTMSCLVENAGAGTVSCGRQ